MEESLDERDLGEAGISPIENSPYDEPVGLVERTLAIVWQKHLRLTCVGRNHDFFGLGGNSVQGLEIMEEVSARLHLELPVHVLFQNPTLRDLAEQIESMQSS
jgi:tyrocidine synthetase III